MIRRKKVQAKPPERELIEISSENQSVEKILNSTDRNIFLSTADVFVEVLNNLEFNDEEIFNKLLNVQDEIQRKLLSFKCTAVENDENDISNLKNLNLKSAASSTLSICSETSARSVPLHELDLYKEFLTKVNCPFCSEPQTDKFNLINHLFKSCEPLINDKFEEINYIPYSAFQILPNSTIKCNICQDTVLRNLKQYFIHKQTPSHISEYIKATHAKKYTEFLFCSCCKVLIPNNHTQLEFHMKHEIHKTKSASEPKSDYSNKGINCVYLKKKQFKCLDCPNFKCQGPKNILLHFESKKHKIYEKIVKFPKVFCEFCNEEVHIFEVITHFTSNNHAVKEKAKPFADWFELCYYCGFTCNTLKELSLHMKSKCSKINNIRKNNLSPKDSCTKNLAKTNSKDQVERKTPLTESKSSPEKAKIEGNTTKESKHHIIVKDNTDVLEIYRYFKKFGEITSVEIYQEKNLILQFREKSAVEDALLLRDVIQINGMKVDITTDEKLIKPNNGTDKSEAEENLEESNSEGDSESSEHVEPPMAVNHKLDTLIQRVSYHLSNATEANIRSVEEAILYDCDEIFGPKMCSFTGFVNCKLCFAVEVINIYCDVLQKSSEDLTQETSSSLVGSLNYQKNLVKKFHKAFCDSDDWTDVNSNVNTIFPGVECLHKATGRTCKFIFSNTVPLLTDMLSHCIDEVKMIEQFCLIVRFWFSVNELKIKDLEFAVMSLLVFFLMNENVGRNFSIYKLPTKALSFYRFINEKFVPPVSKNRAVNNITVMFRRFLKFLLQFDFQKYIIYLPCKSPIPRNIFKTYPFSSLLESFDANQLSNSAMCIIDPLLSVNLSQEISENDLKLLLEAAQNTLTSTS